MVSVNLIFLNFCLRFIYLESFNSSRVLLGAEKSFVFTFDKESVGLHRSVQLSHLTPVRTS